MLRLLPPDACGTTTVISSDALLDALPILRSQIRTFTATDACGNTATDSRTITWTEDLTAPVITITQTPLPAGCNPSAAAINAALGTATASDACGTPTVISSDAAVTSTGCLWYNNCNFK